MAKPVVQLTPETQYLSVQGPGSFYRYRARTKQARPYGTPAPYLSVSVAVTGAAKYGDGIAGYMYGNVNDSSRGFYHQPYGGSYANDDWYVSAGAEARNQAIAKFQDKIRTDAMLAVNWAERAQAVDMITKRVNQLRRFTSALKRGDLSSIVDALGIKAQPPKHLRRRKWVTSKQIANGWLEFHFGWDPLVKDIFTCVNILQQPVSWPSVVGKSRSVPLDYYSRGNPSGPGQEYATTQVWGYARARCGATVSVSNPNLWLANQLGVVNPAAILFELTPWSFLLDWFVNVGQFLSQYTDSMGLTFQDPWTTTVWNVPAAVIRYDVKGLASMTSVESSGFWLQRKLGISGVTLKKRQSKRLSTVRAATAISLLVQQLPGRATPTRSLRAP